MKLKYLSIGIRKGWWLAGALQAAEQSPPPLPAFTLEALQEQLQEQLQEDPQALHTYGGQSKACLPFWVCLLITFEKEESWQALTPTDALLGDLHHRAPEKNPLATALIWGNLAAFCWLLEGGLSANQAEADRLLPVMVSALCQEASDGSLACWAHFQERCSPRAIIQKELWQALEHGSLCAFKRLVEHYKQGKGPRLAELRDDQGQDLFYYLGKSQDPSAGKIAYLVEQGCPAPPLLPEPREIDALQEQLDKGPGATYQVSQQEGLAPFFYGLLYHLRAPGAWAHLQPSERLKAWWARQEEGGKGYPCRSLWAAFTHRNVAAFRWVLTHGPGASQAPELGDRLVEHFCSKGGYHATKGSAFLAYFHAQCPTFSITEEHLRQAAGAGDRLLGQELLALYQAQGPSRPLGKLTDGQAWSGPLELIDREALSSALRAGDLATLQRLHAARCYPVQEEWLPEGMLQGACQAQGKGVRACLDYLCAAHPFFLVEERYLWEAAEHGGVTAFSFFMEAYARQHGLAIGHLPYGGLRRVVHHLGKGDKGKCLPSTQGKLRYLKRELPHMADRLTLPTIQGRPLERLFLCMLVACSGLLVFEAMQYELLDIDSQMISCEHEGFNEVKGSPQEAPEELVVRNPLKSLNGEVSQVPG